MGLNHLPSITVVSGGIAPAARELERELLDAWMAALLDAGMPEVDERAYGYYQLRGYGAPTAAEAWYQLRGALRQGLPARSLLEAMIAGLNGGGPASDDDDDFVRLGRLTRRAMTRPARTGGACEGGFCDT